MSDSSPAQPLTERERALVTLAALEAGGAATHAAVCSVPDCPNPAHLGRTIGDAAELVVSHISLLSQAGEVEHMLGTWERDPDEEP